MEGDGLKIFLTIATQSSKWKVILLVLFLGALLGTVFFKYINNKLR